MSRKRLLATWIGHNDMRAFALSLPSEQRDKILSALPGPRPVDNELGPIKTLVQQESFDEITLLSNYCLVWEENFSAWLDSRTHVVHVELNNPTDYTEIFRLVNGELGQLKSRADWPETDLFIHLSPGSPAMAAIWLLLGKTRYPATFYQTYKGKAWVTNVPFDLAVDFVPEVFRDADAHLQHLTVLSARPDLICGDFIRGSFRSHVTERVPLRAGPPLI